MPSVKNNPSVVVINFDSNIIDPLAYIDYAVEQNNLELDQVNTSLINEYYLETMPDKESLEKRKEFYIDLYKAIKTGIIYPFISYTTLAEISLANNAVFTAFVKKYCYTQKVIKTGRELTLECADEIDKLATAFVSRYKFIDSKTGEEHVAQAPMQGEFVGTKYNPQRDAVIAATGAVFGLTTITNNAKDFVYMGSRDEKGKRRRGIIFLCRKYGYVNGTNSFGNPNIGLPMLVSELQEIMARVKFQKPSENPFKNIHSFTKSRLKDFQSVSEIIELLKDKLEIPLQDFDSEDDVDDNTLEEDNAGEDFDSSNINENLSI